MRKVTRFFAGANSGAGFQSLFHEIMDVEEMYDFILLKGGPGVGKSTFMREIGKAMEDAGTTVEYLCCSGDPDSLDGVVLPEIHSAIVDATAPHVLEPQYPAAVDRYLDLGRFYDLTAAKASVQEVKTYTAEYKAAYKRAYYCLQAARQIELEAAAVMLEGADYKRLEKRVEGIISREYGKKRGTRGKTTRRFLGSITHKGYVWQFESVWALCERVYEVEDTWGLAGNALEQLHRAAAERGLYTIVCLAPENMERIEHLLIPELELAFVTTREGMAYKFPNAKRIRVDALIERKKPKLQIRLIRELREEGVCNLKQAKNAHDLLEGVYNPYVDFDGVRTMAALEAGRMLSYL